MRGASVSEGLGDWCPPPPPPLLLLGGKAGEMVRGEVEAVAAVGVTKLLVCINWGTGRAAV